MKSRPILCVLFGPIGDALMTLAFFDDILKMDPTATFTIITTNNVAMIADLAKAYPSVRVLEIPRRPWPLLRFIFSLLRQRWILLSPGVARQYSFQLKAFFMLMYIVPGNNSIGFTDIRKRSGWLPFRTVLHYDLSIHIMENYRRMIPYILPGVVSHRPPEMKLVPVFSTDMPEKYIVIHMFGTRPRLSFPPHRWHTLLLELAKSYPHHTLVLTGAKKDQELVEMVAKDVPHTLILISKPILEIAGIIKRAALYIGIDTGITHLAAMLRAPSVIIGNNTNPIWWPTYNPNLIFLTNNERCVCTGDKLDDCRIIDPEDGVAYCYCVYDIQPAAVTVAIRQFI